MVCLQALRHVVLCAFYNIAARSFFDILIVSSSPPIVTLDLTIWGIYCGWTEACPIVIPTSWGDSSCHPLPLVHVVPKVDQLSHYGALCSPTWHTLSEAKVCKACIACWRCSAFQWPCTALNLGPRFGSPPNPAWIPLHRVPKLLGIG